MARTVAFVDSIAAKFDDQRVEDNEKRKTNLEKMIQSIHQQLQESQNEISHIQKKMAKIKRKRDDLEIFDITDRLIDHSIVLKSPLNYETKTDFQLEQSPPPEEQPDTISTKRRKMSKPMNLVQNTQINHISMYYTFGPPIHPLFP
eukprot:TRINITY_DN13379_c0_g1_i1.p1 TRINITY_DN13379_c0_g1~~TRINITY_DN13379_c0_g1_i1.p1  ORF type:complete len:146 (-),score=19.65 TRINITY_DN13379_c0_g1_i1:28-465(-)